MEVFAHLLQRELLLDDAVGVLLVECCDRGLEHLLALVRRGAQCIGTVGYPDRENHRIEAVGERAAVTRRHQVLDHADDGGRRLFLAPDVDALADRALTREQPLRERAAQQHGGHRWADLVGIEGAVVDVLIGQEAAPFHHLQAIGLQQVAVIHVDRGMRGGAVLVCLQADIRAPDIAAVGDLVDACRRLYPGERSQRPHILQPQCIVIDIRQQAAGGQVDQRVIDNAALHAQLVHTVADDEYRIADDGAAQGDLQHQQQTGGLVAHQLVEGGQQFHGPRAGQ